MFSVILQQYIYTKDIYTLEHLLGKPEVPGSIPTFLIQGSQTEDDMEDRETIVSHGQFDLPSWANSLIQYKAVSGKGCSSVKNISGCSPWQTHLKGSQVEGGDMKVPETRKMQCPAVNKY